MNNGLYQILDENPLGFIEQKLNNVFNPISPDPEFIERLKGKLLKPPEVSIESHQKPYWLVLILVSGLVLGIFIHWLVRLGRRSD